MEEILKKIIVEKMKQELKHEIILEDIDRKTHELLEIEHDATELNLCKGILEELEQEKPDFEMLANWIDNFLNENENER